MRTKNIHTTSRFSRTCKKRLVGSTKGVLSTLTVLVLATALFGYWRPLTAAVKNSPRLGMYAPAPPPQDPIPTAPAKEYIYAGTRMIAIEPGITINGHTPYGNNSSNLKNVILTVTGTQSLSANSDGIGNYSVGYMSAGGNFTLTPSKTGDVNGITQADADLILNYVAGNVTLTANQQIAADVTQNGLINTSDATRILNYLQGGSPSQYTGTWKFTPLNRSYSSLAQYQVNQDFTGILLGDVTGDWTPPSSHHATIRRASQPSESMSAANLDPTPAKPDSAAVRIELPVQTIRSGSVCTITISVGDLTGLHASSYELDLTFDPAVLQPASSAFETAGTLSSSMRVAANTRRSGHSIIAAASAAELTGSGTLLKLKFNVVGNTGGSTPLTWQTFTFNEGDPAVNLINGQLTVR